MPPRTPASAAPTVTTAPTVPATSKATLAVRNSAVEERLDQILMHLKRMDSRDRLRTWGGFIKGTISLIPLVIVLWSLWYFAQHGEELLKQMADTAASAAAQYTKTESSSMVDELMKKYSMPGQ